MVTRTIDYKGIPTMQALGAFDAFIKFFNLEKFDIVIEIGTAYGGLSKFIHEQSLIHNFKFVTYDKFSNRLFENLPNPEFDFRNKDCFEESTKSEIIDMLEKYKCLILCDGGNKKREFNLFSNHIQNGSFIMAHDYSPDENYFRTKVRGKIWNWLEIKDEDIAESLDLNVVKSKYYEDFLAVVWISCIKK